jgi:hypothetical protein
MEMIRNAIPQMELRIEFFALSDFIYCESYSLYLIILAGDPATIAFSGTSFVTMEPAPMIAPLCMWMPGRSTQFAPTHTSSPM